MSTDTLDQTEPTRLAYPSRYDHGTLHALGRIAGKVDALVKVMEVGREAPSISAIARDIGEDRVTLPPSVYVERSMDDEGTFATNLRYGALELTVDQAVSLGILVATQTAPIGRICWTWDHYVSSVISHALLVERGEALAGARPGRPHL